MEEVRLTLEKYDALQERIKKLETVLTEVKRAHEAELDKLTREGKIRVVKKPFASFLEALTSQKCSITYKGFDDIQEEVRQHFKRGLFNDELAKAKQNLLDELTKQITDKDTTISNLQAEIQRLRSRSLVERIRNK